MALSRVKSVKSRPISPPGPEKCHFFGLKTPSGPKNCHFFGFSPIFWGFWGAKNARTGQKQLDFSGFFGTFFGGVQKMHEQAKNN
jgi:hypothetical protein